MSKIIQGSEEWFSQRLGKVTASRIPDVVAIGKFGEAATRATYRAALVAERLTGKRVESFTNAAMKWGTECEPLARAAYEAETGRIVTEVGMIDHPRIAMSGASPDGLVDSDGILEIKCPETKAHIATILSGCIPSQYVPQVQWQLACTGRLWCDFVSFDPRMPSDMQLFIVSVDRDDEAIALYEQEVVKFLAEVDGTIKQLTEWQQEKEAA